jgi:hypothetical protein
VNPTALERAMSPYAVTVPQTRAYRRAAQQTRARVARAQRRSRARIERALSAFPKE